MHYDIELNSAAHYPVARNRRIVAADRAGRLRRLLEGRIEQHRPARADLGDCARARSKLKLGTAIYHIYGRSPVTLGIQSATLQDLSGGRLLLGLGVANKTIAAWHSGVFDRPLRRAREYIEIVRKIAAGERVEYEGEIYTHRASASSSPGRRRIRNSRSISPASVRR